MLLQALVGGFRELQVPRELQNLRLELRGDEVHLRHELLLPCSGVLQRLLLLRQLLRGLLEGVRVLDHQGLLGARKRVCFACFSRMS